MSDARLAAERLSGSRSCPERFDVVIAGAGLHSPTVDFAKTLTYKGARRRSAQDSGLEPWRHR